MLTLENLLQSGTMNQVPKAYFAENQSGNESSGNLTGYWKSSSGNLFFIKHNGKIIKITNVSYPKYTYDVKWVEGLVIGFIYPGPDRCALIQRDSEHLLFESFKYKSKDSPEVVLKNAIKELKTPDTIWIRQ